MDFIISLVVILIFVAVSMKKSGQLDEIMNGMKKKNQNEADNVVYEQTEDAPKKKKAKAKKEEAFPGISEKEWGSLRLCWWRPFWPSTATTLFQRKRWLWSPPSESRRSRRRRAFTLRCR